MKHVTLFLVLTFSVFGFANAKEWRDPITKIVFVWVPGGSYQMGCHANAGKCDSNEKPVRTVRLDGFWLGKHEVTQGQWKKIMGSNPYWFKKGDNIPVEEVSWYVVQNFIRRLNKKSSVKFRLPSEAQWEFACRAGGKSVEFGTANGKFNNRLANAIGTQDGYRITAPVGSYPPNALGLHDMSGNVYEWVQDNFTNYGKVGTNNPINERFGTLRVHRGGGWNGGPVNLRCSNRDFGTPKGRNSDLGFRLVMMK